MGLFDEYKDRCLRSDSEWKFIERFEQWKRERLSPFCMTKCKETCCDLREVSVCLHLDELERIIGVWNPRILQYACKEKPSETGGRQLYEYSRLGFCEQFDEKTRMCKIYSQRPFSCAAYPFVFNGESGVAKPHMTVARGCSLTPDTEEYKELERLANEFGIKMTFRRVHISS